MHTTYVHSKDFIDAAQILNQCQWSTPKPAYKSDHKHTVAVPMIASALIPILYEAYHALDPDGFPNLTKDQIATLQQMTLFCGYPFYRILRGTTAQAPNELPTLWNHAALDYHLFFQGKIPEGSDEKYQMQAIAIETMGGAKPCETKTFNLFKKQEDQFEMGAFEKSILPLIHVVYKLIDALIQDNMPAVKQLFSALPDDSEHKQRIERYADSLLLSVRLYNKGRVPKASSNVGSAFDMSEMRAALQVSSTETTANNPDLQVLLLYKNIVEVTLDDMAKKHKPATQIDPEMFDADSESSYVSFSPVPHPGSALPPQDEPKTTGHKKESRP